LKTHSSNLEIHRSETKQKQNKTTTTTTKKTRIQNFQTLETKLIYLFLWIKNLHMITT